MQKDKPDLFDYIKYYSMPFDEKLVLARHGKHLNIFKNDPDPIISEIAKTVIEHTAHEDAMLPIHVILKSDLE